MGWAVSAWSAVNSPISKAVRERKYLRFIMTESQRQAFLTRSLVIETGVCLPRFNQKGGGGRKGYFLLRRSAGGD